MGVELGVELLDGAGVVLAVVLADVAVVLAVGVLELRTLQAPSHQSHHPNQSHHHLDN